jgi:ParB family transcriptional regulator, chromosome partitioning protein
MATKKATKAPAKPRRKKNEGDPASRGLPAADLRAGTPPASVSKLQQTIEQEGGTVIGAYRDPIGGHWQLLAGLPLESISPTPFQRDLSETHVARLAEVIARLDRFLDPLIVVRGLEGGYWSPNGYHRLAALRRLGAKSAVGLVIPEEKMAYQILALNTEKAHNLKERALEVIRMARLLATVDPLPEKDFAGEFEEAAFLTLGVCYEQRPRFSGGAYQSLLKKVDAFLDDKLPAALEVRAARAAKLLEIEDAVAELVKQLKEKGVDSPALRGFVVARVNPLRGERTAKGADFDGTLKSMLAAAKTFDVGAIDVDELAKAGGGPPEE